MTRTMARALAFLIVLAAAGPTMAGGPLDLSWHTIDGGGGTSTGSGFVVSGTIGQHDAGAPLTGGSFTLTGGFWSAGDATAVPCPADLSGDSAVGPADLAIILGNWGPIPPNDPIADLNADGIVGPPDLAIVLGSWGPC